MDIKLSTIPRDKHESCWLYLNMMLNFDVRIFYCIDVINWSHGSSYMYPAWSVLHLQLHVHVKGPINPQPIGILWHTGGKRCLYSLTTTLHAFV